jgi:hypothetical protein
MAKREEVERRAMGRREAERTGQRFLELPPPGFRGRVQVLDGGHGAPPYAFVTDGARSVVVRATSEILAARDRRVSVSRDDKGQVVVRKVDRDRGL